MASSSSRPIALIDLDNVFGHRRGVDPAALEVLVAALQYRFGTKLRVVAGSQRFAGTTLLNAAAVQRQYGVRILSGARIEERLEEAGLAALPTADTLVLVSGDGFFARLCATAAASGIQVAVYALPGSASVHLTELADERHSVTEVIHRQQLAGLVAPGEIEVFDTVGHLFSNAEEQLIVIDNFVDDRTVGLMAWSPQRVAMTLISRKFPPPAIATASELLSAGRQVQLVGSRAAHDRFVRVDDEWWHFGASLKDLGRKYSRISQLTDPHEVEDAVRMVDALIADGEVVSL